MFLMLLIGNILSIEFTTSTVLVTLGALIVIGVGFYDDLNGVGFQLKFLVQVIVAYLLLHAGYRVDVSSIPFIGEDLYQQALVSIPLTVFWIVGILNAVNLIDGLDGLAAGVSMIAFVFLSIIFGMQGDTTFVLISLLMIGALAGFLVFNYNPASIFMGDSGSLFLGYMLTVCTLSLGDTAHNYPPLALLVPVIVLGLPLFDTTVCIFRRIKAGGSPFAPDHGHIHHRLSRLWSRRKAVLILYIVAVWFGVSAFLITLVDRVFGFAVVGLTIFIAYLGLRLLEYLELPALKKEAKKEPARLDMVETSVSQGDGQRGKEPYRKPYSNPHKYMISTVNPDLLGKSRTSYEIES